MQSSTPKNKDDLDLGITYLAENKIDEASFLASIPEYTTTIVSNSIVLKAKKNISYRISVMYESICDSKNPSRGMLESFLSMCSIFHRLSRVVEDDAQTMKLCILQSSSTLKVNWYAPTLEAATKGIKAGNRIAADSKLIDNLHKLSTEDDALRMDKVTLYGYRAMANESCYKYAEALADYRSAYALHPNDPSLIKSITKISNEISFLKKKKNNPSPYTAPELLKCAEKNIDVEMPDKLKTTLGSAFSPPASLETIFPDLKCDLEAKASHLLPEVEIEKIALEELNNFSTDSKDVYQSYIKASELIQRYKYSQAFTELKNAKNNEVFKARPISPDNKNAFAMICYLIARCYEMGNKQFKDAIPFWKKAYEHIDRSSPLAYIFLFHIAKNTLQVGNHLDAKKYIVEAIKLCPEDSNIRKIYATRYFEDYQPLAITEIDELYSLIKCFPELQARIKPEKPEWFIEAAEKKYRKAIHLFSISKSGYDINSLKSIPALGYYTPLSKKELERVESRFELIIFDAQTSITHAILKNTKISLETQVKLIDHCEVLLKISLTRKPFVDRVLANILNNLLGHFNKLESRLLNNETSSGVSVKDVLIAQHYGEVMRKIFPDKANVSFHLEGRIHSLRNDYMLSILMYTKALETGEKAGIYSCRGYDYYRLAKYDEALSDIDKAIELKGGVANTYIRELILVEKAKIQKEKIQKEKIQKEKKDFQEQKPLGLIIRTLESLDDPFLILEKKISTDSAEILQKYLLEKKSTQPNKPSKKERKEQYAKQATLQNAKLLESALFAIRDCEQKINQLNDEKNWKEFENVAERKPIEASRNTRENLKELTSQIINWKAHIEKVKEYSNKLLSDESEDVQLKQREAKEIISASEKFNVDETLSKAEKRAEKILATSNESKKSLDNITSTIHTCKAKAKSMTIKVNADMKKLKNLEQQLKEYSVVTTPTQTTITDAKKNQSAIKKIESNINAHHLAINEAIANFSECHKKCHRYNTELLAALIKETKASLDRSLKLITESVKSVVTTNTLADDVIADLQDLMSGMTQCEVIRRSIERDATRVKEVEQKIILHAEDIYVNVKKLTEKSKLSSSEIEEAEDKSSDLVKTIGIILSEAISGIKAVESEIKRVHQRKEEFIKKYYYDKLPKIPTYDLTKLTATITFLEKQASIADTVSTDMSDKAQKISRGMQSLDDIKNQIALMDNACQDSTVALSKMADACEDYLHPEKIDYLALNDLQQQIKNNVATIEMELKLILLIREKLSADISLDSIKLIKEQEAIAKSVLRKMIDLSVKADEYVQRAEELHTRRPAACPQDPATTDMPFWIPRINRGTTGYEKDISKSELPSCHFYSPKNPARQQSSPRHENNYMETKEVPSLEKRVEQCEKVCNSLFLQFAERKIISPTDQKVLVFILRVALVELAFTEKFNQRFRNNVIHNMSGYFDTKYSHNELFSALKEYISCLNQENKINKDRTSTLKDPLLQSLLGIQLNEKIPRESVFTEADHYAKLVELVTFESEGLIEKSTLKRSNKDFAHQALRNRMRDHALKSGNIELADLSYYEIQQYIREHHPRRRG